MKFFNYVTPTNHSLTSLLAHLILDLCSVYSHWFNHLPLSLPLLLLSVSVLAFHVKMPGILFEKK